MIATAKKKTVAKFPKAKISHAVQEILKGQPFKIQVANSNIGKMKIVRVVTPAWKSLRPAIRIGKVLDAVNTKLTAQEQKGNFVTLNRGATVDDLIRALNALGVTPRDTIAILEALKAAGALQAEVDIL